MGRLNIQGQWVLVTGASGGIGAALAREFAAQGARLVLVSRNAEKLHVVAEALGVSAFVVAADLETSAGVDELFRAVKERGLAIEHVVNCAGFGLSGPCAELDELDQARQIELNCVALTRVTRHFLPAMLERGRGGFLQVASVVGLTPTPYMAVYAATKAYVVAFNAALTSELRGTGVHATTLCPGSVATGFQARAGFQLGALEKSSQLPASQVAEQAVRAYLGRRKMIVPGVTNTLLVGLAGCVPPGVSASISGAVVRYMGRDKVR